MVTVYESMMSDTADNLSICDILLFVFLILGICLFFFLFV